MAMESTEVNHRPAPLKEDNLMRNIAVLLLFFIILGGPLLLVNARKQGVQAMYDCIIRETVVKSLTEEELESCLEIARNGD